MPELLELRDLAVRIALECGSIPAEAQPRSFGDRMLRTATKSSAFDLVTEMDEATERAITAAIQAARPQDGIMGEEGAATASASGYTWIVDPIDGTVNYFYGLPHWCICLGIVDANGVPVVGVVHAPALGETFVAAQGYGAFVQASGIQTQLVTPPDVPMQEALLATGFSYNVDRRVDMARVFQNFAPRVRDMRRAGAAGLDIAYTAAGRIHGYYERDLKPWDRAAGAAIAREVGCTVFVHGDVMASNLTIVAPPRLAQTLQDELAALGVTD